MLAALATLAMFPQNPGATFHASDASPLSDPQRLISRITKTSFTIQYWTTAPCENRIEIRQSDIPRTAYKHPLDGVAKIFHGPGGTTQWHSYTVDGLLSGKRYYYRIWDPTAKPTPAEALWGATDGYRREYAVSTLAPKGFKTVIHIPVKVLIMPNVLNVASAYAAADEPAPMPDKLTTDQIALIRSEYATSSRLLWVASGMRVWIDYQLFIDDRWQRWGPEPPTAAGSFKGLPQCRSYSGKDYDGPGGGTWTILDTKHVETPTNDPVYEEKPYPGQIEQAFPRRWNLNKRHWDFYDSGGGTFGLDDWPKGIPGRSQFLGGGDTAWLATYEFHHDMESQGQFSLSNREDDRIVFDHPAPRHRILRGDGSLDEAAWTTSGRHGEHWDIMSYWDRQITDCQWLRMLFGETIVVKDADEDGFPDDGPRLPLDEKRFGSSSKLKATDGSTPDLVKVMQSNWAPGPLQSSWTKPPFQGLIPDPKRPGFGDPYPLYPYQPIIVPKHMDIDGTPEKWSGVPVAGSVDKGGVQCVFKEAHDDFGYYGQYVLHGPWKRVEALFDGEGNGVYNGVGVLSFQTLRTDVSSAGAGPEGPLVSTRPLYGGSPGLKIKASKLPDGGMAVEFSLPNRGVSPWYWDRGGNEIGVELNVWDADGHGYSMWEPYRLFYARMIEPSGEIQFPSNAPAEIGTGPDVHVYRPGDPALIAEPGWTVANGVATHEGAADSMLFVGGLTLTNFDVLAVVEAKSDAILACYAKQIKKMAGNNGYFAIVGRDGNTASLIKTFDSEYGGVHVGLGTGPQRVQFSRRNGEMWLLLNGKPIVYAVDPNSRAVFDRVGIFGQANDHEVVHELRIRAG